MKTASTAAETSWAPGVDYPLNRPKLCLQALVDLVLPGGTATLLRRQSYVQPQAPTPAAAAA